MKFELWFFHSFKQKTLFFNFKQKRYSETLSDLLK